MQLKYLPAVATLKINAEKCNGCAMCTHVCPHQVINMQMKKAVVRDLDACMECGACMMNCSEAAIEVQPGVGCAYAIFRGMIAGSSPQCGCG